MAHSPLTREATGRAEGMGTRDLKLGRKLPNKPLVEAIAELRWELQQVGPDQFKDPGFPLLVGALYGLLRNSYSVAEELPTAQVPDEMLPYVVRYRFRRGKNSWPLVQVGPGIATLNFTKEYDWESFLAAALEFYDKLVEAHQVRSDHVKPKFTSIVLQFINAIPADPAQMDVLHFVSSKLHTSVTLPRGITESPSIAGGVTGFQLSLAYSLGSPKGIGAIRLSTGSQNEVPSLLWHLYVQSVELDVPQERSAFKEWLEQAHTVVESWFFALIEGELEKQFGGDLG